MGFSFFCWCYVTDTIKMCYCNLLKVCLMVKVNNESVSCGVLYNMLSFVYDEN